VTSRTRRNGVTIREIAREAGVSTATVSRALRQPDRVAPRTREAVVAVARRHHYIADGLAGSLASRRSLSLGLVIPTIMNSIYAFSTQAVQRAAQEAGYATLICISEFSPIEEERLIVKLIERRVDGLILTGATRTRRIRELIRYHGLPCIVTWIGTDPTDVPSVSFNNAEGVRMAIEHLVSLGHRRIGFVCGRASVNDRAAERLRSYHATMQRLGLAVDPGAVLERDFDYSEGYAALRHIARRKPRPTAVHCANDVQAVGALQACRDLGIAVPEEMSIIGFDDHPSARYTTPQLTTIRVPAADMGQRAARALIANLRDGAPIGSVELPLDLVVRSSTASPTYADA
jgi:LacI family transcriptional regulator, galactose operon repressor